MFFELTRTIAWFRGLDARTLNKSIRRPLKHISSVIIALKTEPGPVIDHQYHEYCNPLTFPENGLQHTSVLVQIR